MIAGVDIKMKRKISKYYKMMEIHENDKTIILAELTGTIIPESFLNGYKEAGYEVVVMHDVESR
jgi:hypothetical protein